MYRFTCLIYLFISPFKERDVSYTFIIKILPYRKHIMFPLQGPNAYCFFWKYSMFIVKFIHKLTRVQKLARVLRRQNAKLKLNFDYMSTKGSSHFLPLAKFAVIAAIFMKILFFWNVATNRIMKVTNKMHCID
jgi:hypothetical protein